jgi:hypothetical protein
MYYQHPPQYHGAYPPGGGGGYYGGYNSYPPAPRPGNNNNSANTLTLETNNPDLDKQSVDSQSQNSKSPEEELDEVKPIQTDFHCFVLEWKDKLLREAEAEVEASLQGYESDDYKAKHRLYLLNSNLNCRLMKKWEDFTMDEREDFFQKEEDDRRRFTTEDEVISRHCFTLTARLRSPTKRNSTTTNSDEESSPERPEKRPLPPSVSSPTTLTDEETPPKKTRGSGLGAKDATR